MLLKEKLSLSIKRELIKKINAIENEQLIFNPYNY